jgi:hypothetical protein
MPARASNWAWWWAESWSRSGGGFVDGVFGGVSGQLGGVSRGLLSTTGSVRCACLWIDVFLSLFGLSE